MFPGTERRQNRRVKFVAEVVCEALGRDDVFLSRDISAGGVFLTTEEPLPADSHVLVSFPLGPDGPMVSCSGQVVYSESGVGMGIQFFDAGGELKLAIKKLARFSQSKRPIPWVRVYSVPAFVFWSHRTHLEAAQQCAACHGNVSEMDVLQATNVTTMDGCVQCHEKKDASTGCVSCHEGRGAWLEQPFKLPTSMPTQHGIASANPYVKDSDVISCLAFLAATLCGR